MVEVEEEKDNTNDVKMERVEGHSHGVDNEKEVKMPIEHLALIRTQLMFASAKVVEEVESLTAHFVDDSDGGSIQMDQKMIRNLQMDLVAIAVLPM